MHREHEQTSCTAVPPAPYLTAMEGAAYLRTTVQGGLLPGQAEEGPADARTARPAALYPDGAGRLPHLRIPPLTAQKGASEISGAPFNIKLNGRLVFTADTTKNRSERYALLPADLYAQQSDYAGRASLWERYPAELREATAQEGRPGPPPQPGVLGAAAVPVGDRPDAGLPEGKGRHLSSHDFRRAAFTRAAERDLHPKWAAVAFDVTAETMLRYYTATEKQRTADEVLGQLASDLLPRAVERDGG